jgi:hypothetical protein
MELELLVRGQQRRTPDVVLRSGRIANHSNHRLPHVRAPQAAFVAADTLAPRRSLNEHVSAHQILLFVMYEFTTQSHHFLSDGRRVEVFGLDVTSSPTFLP